MEHRVIGRGPRLNTRALRAYRVEAGLTQVDLAKIAGVSACHVSRIEAGTRPYPSPRITKAIADALQLRVGDLLAAAEVSS